MKRYLLAGIFVVGLSLSAGARPQLVGEAVEGTHRICFYGPALGYTPGAQQRRSASVGLAENCPSTFPTRIANGPVPPTAMLESESVEGDVRHCFYRELGYRWQQDISIRSGCPLAAGMLARNTEAAPERRR
jgi:hypothetical protein